ncbi:MAG: recombinase family protein [SAR324 cluster bacterium]|nr:recombinase family protein [SAR324 cluster bacterium]
MNEFHQKIQTDHLTRNAYLYIRQSTLRQVFENTESTKRQYALKEKMVALGWSLEQIIVIDSDLGQSGSSSVDREGFKTLVTEVGMGKAGIVVGLEVSRLARNSSDWHRLLEICALTNTLILDEDGIYDPGYFNDRLLLGLKGTMSEAELHVLKSRLQGGIFAKATRGELKTPLPVGFVYQQNGKVILDPDQQIQKCIHLFFEVFQKSGSACGVVKYFSQNGLKFPRKLRKGINKGEVIWGELVHSRTLQILHNPRYAGAFFYGRVKSRKLVDGTTKYEKIPPEQWHSLLKDSHPSYITWEDYEKNTRRLTENAQAFGLDRKMSPPREGSALLQGIVVCGVCGLRMSVRYHTSAGKTFPDYMCQRNGIEHGNKICQGINGEGIDESLGLLLMEVVSPMALEVALSVENEIKTRAEEVDGLRKQQVERARYETDLAKRRYLLVDPQNRLVADSLEADWNEKLRILAEAQEEYQRKCKSDCKILSKDERNSILALASDFPRLWRNPNTPIREKKRMVRLLVEDVTLIKDREITAHVRFKGGRLQSIKIPMPIRAPQLFKTSEAIVSQVDRLMEKYTDSEIADILNQSGKKSGRNNPFNATIVANIRRTYNLESLYERLRRKNLLTLTEMTQKLPVSRHTWKKWAKKNLIKSYRYNDKNERLYQWSGNELVVKIENEKQQGRSKEFIKLLSNHINGVQYEA